LIILPSGILGRKELLDDVLADEDDRTGQFDVVRREIPAHVDAILVGGEKMLVGAAEGEAGRALATAVDRLGHAVAVKYFQADDIAGTLHQALVAQGLGQGDVAPQVELAALGAVAPAIGGKFGKLEHVRPEETEPGLDGPAQG
jgi:hypothetical protein